VVNPLEGYPWVLGPVAADRLQEAHRELLTGGSPLLARQVAEELLSTDHEMGPAAVLAGQAAFVQGDEEDAWHLASPWVERVPGYVAAALLAGRSAERLGRVVESHAAYASAADVNQLAGERARLLLPRAVEILGNRFQDRLARGRLPEAETELDQLRRWAPQSPVTLEAAADLAEAQGDREGELQALRSLRGAVPLKRGRLERLGDLELEAGDPGAGLTIFRSLAEAHPADPALAEKLSYASFRFKLTVLPPRVQEIAGRAELERGDGAVLLYWLFPAVRYGRPVRTRIAADILDDPRREEITRVINLGLMDLDETLHAFFPEGPLRRGSLLRGLLRILTGNQPPVACLQALPEDLPTETVCAVATRCGLLPGPQDCLPQGEVSGREALAFVRKALELAGGP
jgi:tetratricopeptide (TPR) repeat protein